MRRFILTGAPGSGKTAILRQLELDGFSVVEEAATDIIALWQVRGVAEPWKHPSFIDAIAALQRQRQVRASRETGEVQFHDRSAICTAALAVYLGYPLSDTLSRELKRIETGAIYQKHVFFIHLLYAPLTMPLVYCYIKSFQRASSVARPFQGGEKTTAVWASHHEELCSDGVVTPHVCAHMVVPHRWVVLDG